MAWSSLEENRACTLEPIEGFCVSGSWSSRRLLFRSSYLDQWLSSMYSNNIPGGPVYQMPPDIEPDRGSGVAQVRGPTYYDLISEHGPDRAALDPSIRQALL